MTLLDFYDNLTCSVNEESDTNMDSDAGDENLPETQQLSPDDFFGRDLPAVAANHGDQLAIAVKKAKTGTVLKASRAKSPATEKENLPIRKSRRKCSVQKSSSDPDLPAVGVVQLAIPVNKVSRVSVLKASRAELLTTENENLPVKKSRRKRSVQMTSSDPDLPAVGVDHLAVPVKKAIRVSVLKASSAELPANESENLPVKKSRRKCSVQTTSSVPDLPAVGDDQLAIPVKKARRSSVLKVSSTDDLPSKSRSRKFIN